ncbi:cleavage factor two protein 2 [Monosporozyma unispora]
MTFKYMCCDDGSGSPVGTMIQFENVTILIDPSWNAADICYEDAVKYWSAIVPEIDLIILSEPTIDSLGAYALLYYNFLSHFLSRIEVFATLPIANLGRVSTIDYYASRGVVGPYTSNEMDVDDVEKAFDFIRTLKYSQIVDLKFKFDGLSLVAFNSGSSPGGSLWCISTYVEKLVYAKRWNHTKGTLLNGANLLDSSGKPISAVMRPSAVITTFDKFGLSRPFKRRNREFKDTIKEYLTQKKSVIIPVEISNQFLELFVIIHDLLYSSKKMGRPLNSPILLVSYSRGRSLTYAKSMLEWLTASLLKVWSARDNESPFNMGKTFHIVGVDELSKFSGPKVCLVSDVDTLLTEVVKKLHTTEKLNIILTQSNSNSNSKQQDLLSQLYKKWNDTLNKESLKEGDLISFNESVQLSNCKYEYLKDEDLKEFTNKIEERRESNKKKEEILKQQLKNGTDSFKRVGGEENGLNSVDIDGNGNTGDEEDEDDDEDDIFLNKNRQESNNENIEVPIDIYIQEKTKYKMFPFNPKREKPDDYGAVIDFTQFIPKEDDDMEVDGEDGADGSTSGGEKNKSKKDPRKRIQSDSEEEEDDEDEYVISDIPVKKARRGRLPKDVNDVDTNENFDNIDYLDALNRPSKRIIDQVQVRLKVSITHFNLDNIVDQRSATVIWPLLKTRKMILLGPPEAQNETVISNLSKKNTDIMKTAFNDKIIMDTAIKTLDISIDTELDQLLNWQKIGDDHTVAQVVGRLVKEVAKETSKDVGKEQSRSRGKLVLKPLEKPTIFNSSGTLSIGDVRLAELKRKLTEQNYVAEFKGEGTLVIDDQVAVRKINDGETIIDGSPSELFDTVKTLVTDMLAKI